MTDRDTHDNRKQVEPLYLLYEAKRASGRVEWASAALKQMRALTAISALVFSSFANSGGFILTHGKGDAYCEALSKYVNRVNPRPPLRCTSDLVRHMPGVVEAPSVELAIEDHEDLYKKILYYSRLPKTPETSAERLQRDYEEAVRTKRVRMLMTRMDIDPSDPEPETIVQLRWKGCLTDSSKETSLAVLVTPDLTDIDKRKMSKLPLTGAWQLVLYRSEPQFVSGGVGGEYGIDSARGFEGGLTFVCSLNSSRRVH